MEDDRYTRAQRWKALLLAYILPFVLLAGVIVLADWLTDNEYIIGGAALATVAVYYLVLFAVKPKV
ncbi:MAG: SoxR reducing system RseC family protein [Elusimicrobiaceae bacterium]|nr:SoxR reducing system RseC family protein [Elusimicrobiaceae bacterium]